MARLSMVPVPAGWNVEPGQTVAVFRPPGTGRLHRRFSQESTISR